MDRERKGEFITAPDIVCLLTKASWLPSYSGSWIKAGTTATARNCPRGDKDLSSRSWHSKSLHDLCGEQGASVICFCPWLKSYFFLKIHSKCFIGCAGRPNIYFLIQSVKTAHNGYLLVSQHEVWYSIFGFHCKELPWSHLWASTYSPVSGLWKDVVSKENSILFWEGLFTF